MRLSIVVLSALLLTGCVTPSNPRSVASAVKVAAYVGSYEALRQHPEWGPGFRAAHDELIRIESLEKIDFVTVLSIVHRLPVKELKSDRAVLYITAATLLLEGYTGSVDLSNEEVKGVVRALREGIALALPPPGPTASVYPPSVQHTFRWNYKTAELSPAIYTLRDTVTLEMPIPEWFKAHQYK